MGISALSSSYRQNSDTWWDFTEREKHWVEHDVTVLNYDECKRLSEQLTADFRCQTAKGILYVLAALVGYCATIALGILILDSILPFFELDLNMPGLGMVVGLTAYFGVTLFLSFQLWVPVFFKGIYYWEHAGHIGAQQKECTDRMQLLLQGRA